MKKQAYTLIGALVFATMFAFSTVRAQSNNYELIANIPFEFSAGSQTLPAGEYRVTVVNPSSDQRVLKLTNTHGKTVMVAMHSVEGKARNDARLVFHRYGDQFYLAQAWAASDPFGLEAPRTRAERASQLARNERRTETETIAMAAKR
jgi:hypothetical protein